MTVKSFRPCFDLSHNNNKTARSDSVTDSSPMAFSVSNIRLTIFKYDFRLAMHPPHDEFEYRSSKHHHCTKHQDRSKHITHKVSKRQHDRGFYMVVSRMQD